MTLSDVSPEALAYAGTIVSGVGHYLSTADLWQAIHEAGAAMTPPSPSISVQEVNTLRAWAASNRSAAEALNAAGPTAPLTGDMIGITLSPRTGVAMAAAPEYMVRIQLFGTDATGNEVSKWVTITTIHTLPTTVGTFDTLVGTAAAAAGVGYGITTVEWGTASIVAV